MEVSKTLKFKSKLTIGPLKSNDPLFEEDNHQIKYLRTCGIYETDNEDFLHESFPTFKCNVSGCRQEFDSIFQYDQHYNAAHRYSCCQCKMILPSPFFLDLHVSESHDSYFAVQAERKPMYRCFIEECPEILKTPAERKDHCVKSHKFPSNYEVTSSAPRKNSSTWQQAKKKGKGGKKKSSNNSDGVKDGEDVMETDEVKQKKVPAIKVLGFRSNGKKRIALETFSHDLLKSLPPTDSSAVSPT